MSDKSDEVKAFTLNGFTNAVREATKVINVKELEPNYKLAIITTDETEYDITVLNPHTGQVRVKGGIFTEPTDCHFTGSGLGCSLFWVDRIAIGLCMEFLKYGRVITMPVKAIGWRIDPIAVVTKTVLQ